ncbi:MAG: carbon-nitrogen hydrolase family protein [Clostridia bacterium]|nr:carbon-nitrogen hydrolase family protein [Clostridia bacterium]
MRISLIQMSVDYDKSKNILHASDLIKKASGADVIMLPEMFCCPYSSESFIRNAEDCGGSVARMLERAARDTGAYIIGGSMPEIENGRIYNTCLVYDPSGKSIARHRKAHMFDVDIKGGQCFRESDTLTPGADATTFDTPFGRFGLCICFDIRFSGFIHSMRGIDFLAVPAAFNMTTGPLHWELLFRARAVDEQVFTFGCAPARDEHGAYVSYANSIAVSPWGRVIARAGYDEEILSLNVNVDEVGEVRQQIPIR